MRNFTTSLFPWPLYIKASNNMVSRGAPKYAVLILAIFCIICFTTIFPKMEYRKFNPIPSTVYVYIPCISWSKNPPNGISQYGCDLDKVIAVNTLRPRKISTSSKTTFWNGFSWVKMYQFRLDFYWNLFLGTQLTISQHWFGYWPGGKP